jgi:hypothetical protein
MKTGDTVECVNSEFSRLTFGKRYEVYDAGDPIFVIVVNDDGDKVHYFRERFKEVKRET